MHDAIAQETLHDTLAREWRRRMATRGILSAALLSIPVLVAAVIGFSAGPGGFLGLGAFAGAPSDPSAGAAGQQAGGHLSRLVGSASSTNSPGTAATGTGAARGDAGGGSGGGGGLTGGGGSGGGRGPLGTTGSGGSTGPGTTGTTGGGTTLPDPTGTNPDGGDPGLQIPLPEVPGVPSLPGAPTPGGGGGGGGGGDGTSPLDTLPGGLGGTVNNTLDGAVGALG